jgi:hypothetical protein
MVYQIYEERVPLRSHAAFSLHGCADCLCYHSLSTAQIIFIWPWNSYILVFFVSIEKSQTVLYVLAIVWIFFFVWINLLLNNRLYLLTTIVIISLLLTISYYNTLKAIYFPFFLTSWTKQQYWSKKKREEKNR